MKGKQRLSASIDSELIDAARAAVAAGRAENVSAWVNEALLRQVDHESRMQALDGFLLHYESEHGEITEEEMRDAARAARSRAVVVREGAPGVRRRTGAA
jgi:hypothetical protein